MYSKAATSFILLAVIQLLGSSNAANILFFAGFGTHSTRLSKWPLMEALAEKGHSVTYLSPYKNFELDAKKKSKINTYEPKLLAESAKDVEDQTGDIYDIRKNGAGGTLDAVFEMFDIGVDMCEKLYSDPEFIEWVKSSKFDLVVVETWLNECALGLIDYWGAKWAVYSTSVNPPWYSDEMGLPVESSSIPEMATPFELGMSFPERVINAMIPVGFNLLRDYRYFPALEEMTRKRLGRNVKSFREVEKNATIIYITQHYSTDFARAYPSNVVPVGGNVVSKKIKPLPADMEKFINSSKGFIYVSFGTVVDFTRFDKDVQVEFINALGQFPDTKFVWKSHNDINVTKIPENVFVTKWAPQQTVLAHPKIKAFITHSGQGSTTEGIHFSVPLICVPLGGDQDGNANMIARKGAGLKVEIVDMKQEQLVTAIKEILENKKYKEGMNRLTKIFNDRPIPVLENAVWWTEYVLRYDNVQEYLAHPSIHQPWWKRRQIDVWVSAAFIVLIVITSTIYILCTAIRKISSVVHGTHSNALKQKVN